MQKGHEDLVGTKLGRNNHEDLVGTKQTFCFSVLFANQL